MKKVNCQLPKSLYLGELYINLEGVRSITFSKGCSRIEYADSMSLSLGEKHTQALRHELFFYEDTAKEKQALPVEKKNPKDEKGILWVLCNGLLALLFGLTFGFGFYYGLYLACWFNG